MKTDLKPVRRNGGLVIQELNGEILIYDLTTDKAFCLNPTSALVWQACDGEKSIEQIIGIVRRQVGSDAVEDLVWLALDQLRKESLLETEIERLDRIRRLSRREVIKKIGLGSVAALPLIASLAAPTSVYAQMSCTPFGTPPCNTGGGTRPNGCACTNNNNCTSNNCVSGCCRP